MSHKPQSVTRGFIIIASLLTPIFGTLFFVTLLVNASDYTPIKNVTFSLKEKTMQSFDVVLTGNQARLNAAEVELFYNPEDFYVTHIDITNALCDPQFVIEKEIDNEAGRLYYACGTITPFSMSTTTLATVYIEKRAHGSAEIYFSSTSTNALAHDGYGTNLTKERLPATLSFSG